ncbi:MAG: LPXTG cell wall anchor domain-containing protein, partial [Actinomycetota bacterium]
RYPIVSATGLVEFGSRIALFSKPEIAMAAWTDTRNSAFDGFQQEIYATQIRFPRPETSSGPPWVAGGAGALVLLGGWLVWRKKQSTRRVGYSNVPASATQ